MPRTRGFTLLEMLVVLVMAGLALMLAVQAVGQYQRAQASVLQVERAGREYRLGEAWLRSAVGGLQALEGTGFEGDAEGFRGLTLAPLMAPQGVGVEQAWRRVFATDGGWALAVTEEGRDYVIVLREAGGLRFSYLDADGAWQPQWPPALGEHAMLPEAVMLQIDALDPAAGPRVLVAAVAGPRRPAYRPFEREVDL